ncbi:NF038129 family PEP-CTERM protein [Massilia niabensis]|uniref:NF038129 family PEP-CTERM protein n=1 Tax=Massilia niabensis TaxID=544910 RepID=A0ABW0LC11_9BURK
MFNLKNLFTRALLALMLVGAAGAASAGPIYRVTIDTSSEAGSGVFDFSFLGFETAADATAVLSNFRGNYGGSEIEGDVSGSLETGIILGNSEFTSFLQSVNLGGLFGFDVEFDVQGEGDGTTFAMTLYDTAFSDLLLSQGPLVQIDLMPGVADFVSIDNAFVSVSEVPEPATLASLALGLALMGSTLRARRKG